MIDYHYTLIRFVPDPQRMEPINVGIILQGQGRVEVRFNPHAAKLKKVDTDAFRRWKQFFSEEIEGESVPLFQPDRASPEFLQYLERLCEGPVLLSKSLVVSVAENRDFGDVLQGLLGRLVLPPEAESAAEIARPTGRFRKASEDHRFMQRGMKKYAHVDVPGNGRWTAYRQVLNGEFIAIDKVEVSREIGRTADEIDKLERVAELLQKFKETKVEGKATRYVLLADPLEQAFAEQTPDDFKVMHDDLEAFVARIGKLGGEVLRTPNKVEDFAKELDQKLAPATRSE